MQPGADASPWFSCSPQVLRTSAARPPRAGVDHSSPIGTPSARAIRSIEPTLGRARPRSSWLRKGWESPASRPSCLSVHPRSLRSERTRAPSAEVASSVESSTAFQSIEMA